MDRNRYSDILAYKSTRVVLLNGVSNSDAQAADYIHASYVNSPFPNVYGKYKGDRKIIAS